MKFSAREDIAAPTKTVFASLTDFSRFERRALRRGVEVQRTDDLEKPGAGMTWDIGFSYRGRRRSARAVVTKYHPDEGLDISAKVGGLVSAGTIDLTPLGPSTTRLHVVFETRPETFRARMLLQALRLGKARLNERFKARVARFARTIDQP